MLAAVCREPFFNRKGGLDVTKHAWDPDAGSGRLLCRGRNERELQPASGVNTRGAPELSVVCAERVTGRGPRCRKAQAVGPARSPSGKALGRDSHRGDGEPGRERSLGPATHMPAWERGCLERSSASRRAAPRDGRSVPAEGAAASGELAGASLGVQGEQARKTTAISANALMLQQRKAPGVGRGSIPGGVQGRGEPGNASKDVTFMASPDD